MPLGIGRAVTVAVGLPEVSFHTSATFTSVGGFTAGVA